MMLQEIDAFKFGTEQIMAVAMLQPDKVVAGSWNGNVAFRNSQDKTTEKIAVSPGPGVTGVAGPTVLGQFAVAGYDGVLHCFDLARRELQKKITVSDLPLTCATVSRRGLIVVLGGRSREIFVLDAREFSLIHRLGLHDGWVEAVALSSNVPVVASGTQAGTIQIWNHETGKSVASFRAHAGAVMCLAISPDGRTMISGGQDRLTKLWSISDVPKLIRSLSGHGSTVRGVGFLADEKILVSVSQDATIRFWKADTGEQIYSHATHDQWLTSLAIAHDATLIATGSLTGMVRLWKIDF